MALSIGVANAQVSVIPQPAQVESRTGTFAIRVGTRLSSSNDPRAARVARYFAELLQQTRGIKLRTSGAGAMTRTIVFKLDGARPTTSEQVVTPGESDVDVQPPTTVSQPSSAEAYTVDISPERIVLSASDPRGLLYAAVTLWQLCTSSHANAHSHAVGSAASGAPDAAAGSAGAAASTGATADAGVIIIPAMKITDAPRFPWRGLMLDSARHYQSPEFILRLIDWMALHKLNVLHWHLTDDQAWRLEIKKYPRLTSVGAWRVPAGPAAAADIDPATGRPRLYGGFYTQEAVRRIVAHASERNVTVVPEIDMPGHATAALVAYPRLASIVPAPAAITSNWGVYSNLYNVDEDTFRFLFDVLAEVVKLFPGKYVHIGGDEAVKDQWKASPHIQARMRELGIPNEAALQSYFIGRVGKFLNAHHRRLIGWDEILEGGIAPDATITSWRGAEGALAAAAAGHDAVLSPAPTLYFDNRQSAMDTQPGRGTVITLEDIYKFDPMPPSLSPDERHHILGLQANIWTEYIRTEQRVEHMTFPRAAALAEVGWSEPGNLDWSRFLARLPDQMSRYQMLNIHAFVPSATQEPSLPHRRSTFQLQPCTKGVVLSLEDDAPLVGNRPTYLLDITNPCWIWQGADMSQVTGIQASVGQLPFEFQLGADLHLPKLDRPRTPSGELEVKLDGCEGDLIGTLALQPALSNNGVTELPAVNIPHSEGKHDLCLKFAQASPDPIWVVNWIQLLE